MYNSAAVVGFIIGFLLLILAALTFFGGSVLLKFCDDAEGPEYVIFAQVFISLLSLSLSSFSFNDTTSILC